MKCPRPAMRSAVARSSPGIDTSGLTVRPRLESNTVTPLLKRMQGQGLITRSRDGLDERQVRVALTESGRAMQDRAAHIPSCIVERSGMTPDELSALRDAAAGLRDRIDRA